MSGANAEQLTIGCITASEYSFSGQKMSPREGSGNG